MSTDLAILHPDFQPPAARECTTETARRIAPQMADRLIGEFPAAFTDRYLLILQIECEYLDWCYRNNCYILPRNFRPVRSAR